MAIAYSDIGTLLGKETVTPGTFAKLVGIKSVPATGGEPAQIEVTELDSEIKQYILDRSETPLFVFEYNYTKENFALVKAAADGVTSANYAIKYPDGSGVEFTGVGATWINGYSGGQAIGATVAFAVTSVEYVDTITGL